MSSRTNGRGNGEGGGNGDRHAGGPRGERGWGWGCCRTPRLASGCGELSRSSCGGGFRAQRFRGKLPPLGELSLAGLRDTFPWGESTCGQSGPCGGSSPPDNECLRTHPPGQEVSKADLPPLPAVHSPPSSSSPSPAADLWSPITLMFPCPALQPFSPPCFPLGWRCHPIPLAAPHPSEHRAPHTTSR